MTNVIELDKWHNEIQEELQRYLYTRSLTDAYILETGRLDDIEEEMINHKPGFTCLEDAKDFAIDRLQSLKADLEEESITNAIYYTRDNPDYDIEHIVNFFTENRLIR